MKTFKKSLPTVVAGLIFSLHCLSANAMGFVPETSMLFIDEADKGASMNLKNTDINPQLLYTSITDLPDDKGTHVLVTQPVARVEGGQSQHLRFILQTDSPLQVEHMKRVVFEGIPQKMPGKNKIGFNVRQDLPVIIHPANLPEVKDAWTLLSWKSQQSMLTVTNNSPYVVRFQPQAVMLPSKTKVKLPKSYILPGQTLTASADNTISSETEIQFFPVSRYGVQVDKYTAQVNMH